MLQQKCRPRRRRSQLSRKKHHGRMNGCSKNTDGSSKKIDTVVAFISMVEAFPLYGESFSVND